MRRDHRPFWLRQWHEKLIDLYAAYFLHPQFDGLGKHVKFIAPRSVHVNGSGIYLGNDIHFYALKDKPIHLSVFPDIQPPGKIEIGDFCIINPGVRIIAANSIKIGKNCMLAGEAYITDADWHDLYHRIFPPGNTSAVVLEDNVWVGDHACICKGVTVGENSIIGARAVVAKDVPANSIVAGNPAKIINTLDPAQAKTTREALFTGPVDYVDFKRDYDRTLTKGNSLWRWLASRLHPTRAD